MRIEGIPDGYEVVRWGLAKKGELYLWEGGTVVDAQRDFEQTHVLIVRKIEPVLDLSKVRLKKGWIAQDKSGENYWYSHKPVIDGPGVGWKHEKCDGRDNCYLSITGLIIPWREDVPWTERIMEITEWAEVVREFEAGER